MPGARQAIKTVVELRGADSSPSGFDALDEISQRSRA
jgi:hypothetical protein